MRTLICVLADVWLVLWTTLGVYPATAQTGFHKLAQFGTAPRQHLVWSPDGSVLALVNTSTVVLYTPDLKKILEFDDDPSAEQVAWSPDGKYLAGAGQSLWIWDIATRQRRTLWPFAATNPTLYDVVWSPDGSRLVTDAGDVWDVDNGRVLATLKHDKYLKTVVWSPDGTQLATSDDTVRIWDARTYELQSTLLANLQVQIENLTWSTDSRTLAGAGANKLHHEIDVWNVRSTNLTATLDDNLGYIYTLAWSPDDKFLASGDDHIRIWDTTTWRYQTLDAQGLGPIDDLAWSHNSTLASLARNEVIDWDIYTGQQLYILNNNDYVAGGPISWSPDSKDIAIGVGSIIQLRNGITGALLKKIDTHQQITLLVWSLNSSLIATSDGSTSVQIWDTNTEQLIHTIFAHPLIRYPQSIPGRRTIAWSPDGTRLAVLTLVDTQPTSHNLKLWDATNWENIATFQADCFSWSPDSKSLAIGLGTNAYTIDSHSGLLLVKLDINDHSHPIFAISWSPQGDRIADEQFYPVGAPYVGEDLIWNAQSGKLLSMEPLSEGFDWQPNGEIVARKILLNGTGSDEASYDDIQLYNFDTKVGQILMDVSFGAWSPDGKQFVIRDSDYTNQIWGQ